MSGTAIYLYGSAANPNDIILRDPTVLARSGIGAPPVESQPAGGSVSRKGDKRVTGLGFSQTWLDDEERRKRREARKAGDLDALARSPAELPGAPVEPKAYENFNEVLGPQPISLSDADMVALRRSRLIRAAAEEAERQMMDDDEAAAILLLLN